MSVNINFIVEGPLSILIVISTLMVMVMVTKGKLTDLQETVGKDACCE